MSFTGYPDYKDSGLSWLGLVPSHWDVCYAKRLITVKSGDMISAEEETPEGYPIIGGNGFRAFTDKTNSRGDTLVIGRVGAHCGCVHHIRNDFWASEHAYRVLEKKPLSKRYFFHLLGALNLNQFAIKTAQPLLNTAIVEEQHIAVPPFVEQSAIAAFLDRETAKIDALVAEQERLIALLKEKRQAVISHAVTKGLNPNAPMKDSGIEWLGQIPAHWETLPLKAASIGEGTVFIDGDWIESKDISEDGIRYITTGNVGEGFYKEQGSGFITDETFVALNCTEVLPGDVLISRLNFPIGRACVVPDLGTRIVTSVDNVIVRAGDHVNRKFLTFLLSAKSFFAHTETLARGTTMQRISRTVLGNIRICLPAIDEQLEIAESLQEQTAGIDALVVEAQSAISLLQERRAALISAAVTGKIDVRGLAETSQELEFA